MVDKKRSFAKRCFAICALGMLSGIINGLFGSGGGVAIVLLLWWLAREELTERERVFANVTAMILPISLASALVYFNLTPPSLAEGVRIAAGGLVGGAVGGLLLGRLKLDVLKKIFAVLLLISGGIMIFR